MDNQEQLDSNNADQALDTNQSDNQEALEASAETPEVEAELESIPEKFVGKSPLDIIKAYNNAERQLSKVSTERAEERKKREDLEKRIQETEERLAKLSQQPANIQTQSPEKEEDPFEEYEKEFDADPKEAIKKIVSKVDKRAEQKLRQKEIDEERIRAANYYQSEKANNPEYAKLEPKMRELAKEFGDLVALDKQDSVKALKLLHLAAQGASRDEYAAEIASKAKKETSAVKQEKRAAFSESSNSKGSNSKRWEDLSVEEMEKLLPKV